MSHQGNNTTRQRLHSQKEKQKQTYDEIGATNKNGMQRQISDGIQISTHGSKNPRFQQISQPVPKKRSLSSDEDYSSEVEFISEDAYKSQPTPIIKKNQPKAQKSDDDPKEVIKNLDCQEKDEKVENTEKDQNIHHHHHLTLPSNISSEQWQEFEENGIQTKSEIISWLDDQEFLRFIEDDEMNEIVARLICMELFKSNLAHTFVDDYDENGNIKIWTDIFMDHFKSINADILGKTNDEIMKTMFQYYQDENNLPRDLRKILKFMKTKTFTSRHSYLKLVFSTDETSQATRNEIDRKEREQYMEWKEKVQLEDLNETIKPGSVEKTKNKPEPKKKSKTGKKTNSKKKSKTGKKSPSKRKLERMNRVIQPDKPDKSDKRDKPKKKITSRSQVPRAKDVQQTPPPPAPTPRIILVSGQQKRQIRELSEMLHLIYPEKADNEITKIARERVLNPDKFADSDDWELDELLTEKESQIYWRKYRDQNILQNNIKKQLINDTKEMVQFSHPDWNEEKLEDEIEKRIQIKLDEGELLEVLTVLDLVTQKEQDQWSAHVLLVRQWSTKIDEFSRILSKIQDVSQNIAKKEVEERLKPFMEKGKQPFEVQKCHFFTNEESEKYKEWQKKVNSEQILNHLKRRESPEKIQEKVMAANKQPLTMSDEDYDKVVKQMNETIRKNASKLQIPEDEMNDHSDELAIQKRAELENAIKIIHGCNDEKAKKIAEEKIENYSKTKTHMQWYYLSIDQFLRPDEREIYHQNETPKDVVDVLSSDDDFDAFPHYDD